MSDPASLQNLHDIVLPAPPGWWPPAPGWYVLAVLLLAFALWWGRRAWQRWRADRYRREALKAFRALQADPGRLAALPGLLKRTALAAWGREAVAALSGEAWHRFLDCSAGTDRFCAGAGALLDRLAYGGEPLSGPEARLLLEAAALWLRGHAVPGRE